MSKLGIKIIVSYVALTIISTVIFFIIIRNSFMALITKNSTVFYTSIYKAFLITMLISLIISLLFEMNIVGPITKIRDNIRTISLDRKISGWKDIYSRDELNEINKELHSMVERLREANKNQKEFFQNTSHELKTPLMSIQGYTEAIKDGVMDKDEIQNALEIIIDESHKLTETINSILYLSSMDKIEKAESDEPELINLYEKVESLIQAFEYAILDKHILVVNKLPRGLEVMATNDQVNKVFNNLFSNAIRYAKRNVEFNFYVDSNKVHFIVSDDGDGFNNDDINRIFDRFYKGDDGKSGLGLSIVKAIIDSVGGEISAYNSILGGATVDIILNKNENIRY